MERCSNGVIAYLNRLGLELDYFFDNSIHESCPSDWDESGILVETLCLALDRYADDFSEANSYQEVSGRRSSGFSSEQALALSELIYRVWEEHDKETSNRLAIEEERKGRKWIVPAFDVDKHPYKPEFPDFWFDMDKED